MTNCVLFSVVVAIIHVQQNLAERNGDVHVETKDCFAQNNVFVVPTRHFVKIKPLLRQLQEQPNQEKTRLNDTHWQFKKLDNK